MSLHATQSPISTDQEMGVRAFNIREAEHIIVVRVYRVTENKIVIKAKPEITQRSLLYAETIRDAVMSTAWVFSVLRDYTLTAARYYNSTGEAIFIK